MKTINKNFAKPELLPNGTLDYAPAILDVVIHHHEEYDEPVFDPETGEPVIDPETGEQKTEHHTRDWDTTETKAWPVKEDYLIMDYIPVIDRYPSEPATEGFHYEGRGWEKSDNRWCRVYEEVENPPPPPKTYSCLYLEAALLKRGLLDAFDALLDSQTIEDPPDSGNVMPLRRAYERANDLSSAHPLFGKYFSAVKAALGADDETAEEILREAETGGL